MNKELHEHLVQTSIEIENYPGGSQILNESDRIQNYLYFATQVERMEIYVAAKSLGEVIATSPLSESLKLELALSRVKPHFEAALKQKGIFTLSKEKFKVELVYEKAFYKIYNDFDKIEKQDGIFSALIQLKRWAHSSNDTKQPYISSRPAASYLQAIVAHLEIIFAGDDEILPFLKWCGKRTRRKKPFGFSKKELKTPRKGALPIHETEAVKYVKYFLKKAVDPMANSSLKYEEMAVYLSLCIAVARSKNNYYDPVHILKVSKENLIKLSPIKGITHSDKTELMLPPWDLKCQGLQIGEYSHVISPKLATAINLLGSFSITTKDVENRLREAHKAIGLTQSSGGISPGCFLFQPILWKNVDTRKNHKNSRKVKRSKNTKRKKREKAS